MVGPRPLPVGGGTTTRWSRSGASRSGTSLCRRRSCFLQSCLALMAGEGRAAAGRAGAVGVLGNLDGAPTPAPAARSRWRFLDGPASTRTARPATSLRQAKNFLLCYAQLKQKRLAGQATRTGANTPRLVGVPRCGATPTFKLPCPPRPDSALPIVRRRGERQHDRRGRPRPVARQGDDGEVPRRAAGQRPARRACCARKTRLCWCRCCSPRCALPAGAGGADARG